MFSVYVHSNYLRAVLTVLLLLVYCSVQKAQPAGDFYFNALTSEQGLSQNTVYETLQDESGFMWFATDDGLNRYDGYSFRIYKPVAGDSTSLSGSLARALYEDEEAQLWIGTLGGGLNKYDKFTERFVRYMPRDEAGAPSCKMIRDIEKADQRSFWIASDDGGVFRFYTDTETFVSVSDRTWPDDRILTIMQSNDGMLWIGTDGEGLWVYNPVNGLCVPAEGFSQTAVSMESNHVSDILQLRDGRILAATMKGAFFYDGGTEQWSVLTRENQRGLVLIDRFLSCYQDILQRVWLGTDGGGLLLYEPRKNRLSSLVKDNDTPFSLSSDYIVSIFGDRLGSLWVGTWDGGVNHYSRNLKKFSRHPALASSNEAYGIWSLYKDRQGVLWFSTLNNGLKAYDSRTGQITTYADNPTLPVIAGRLIRAIYEDDRGRLFLGTSGGGLNVFSPSRRSVTYLQHDAENPNSLAHDHIQWFAADKKDRLWIGTRGGLSVFDLKTSEFVRHFYDGRQGRDTVYSVRAVLCEDDGDVWIGTSNNGLLHYNPDNNFFTRVRAFSTEGITLPVNRIYAIQKDAFGRLWIGSDGAGLIGYDKVSREIQVISETEGLPNNVVYGILEDSNHILWMSTNKGLATYNPSNGEIKQFDARDGLQSNEFNAGAWYEDDSGDFYFGGIKGFTVFTPEQVRTNPHIPPVVITRLLLQNETVEVGEVYRGEVLLEESITYSESITLPRKQNMITFEFAALNYIQPAHNQYAYRLEGFEDEWNEVGNRNFATYTSLQPGEYTLHVIGSNNDGIWNRNGVTLNIQITPPFYLAWWFITLVVLFVMSVIYTGYRVRQVSNQRLVRFREAKIAQQEQALEMKQKELQQSERLSAIGGLVGGFLHEINTPVGVSRTAASALDERTNEFLRNFSTGNLKKSELLDYLDRANEAIRIININLERTHELVESFKEVSVDQSYLTKRSFNLRSYLNKVLTSLRPLLKKTGHTIELNCSERITVISSPGLFYQIFSNLIVNSLKHGFDSIEEGKITITARLRDDQLTIVYADNGRGIPEELQQRVFEQYFTTGERETSSGLGLSIIHSLVTNDLGGNISLKSAPGEGARFFISIPVEGSD